MTPTLRYSFLILLLVGLTTEIVAQTAKAPTINLSGQIYDEYEHVVGWISKGGVVQTPIDDRIAVIDKEGNAYDGKGQRIGKMDKNGSFTDPYGSVLFTVSPPKGHQCEMIDPQGKVMGLVHTQYKNQASALYCLFARNRNY